MNNSAILESQDLFGQGNPGNPDDAWIDISPNSPTATARSSNNAFWTLKYYQQFFDVNTEEVKTRIIRSMVPSWKKNFLETYIRPNPDLYGPFWICTTLIFTIAVSGNVANYLQYAPQGNYHWRYDFHLTTYAATAIFSYAWLVPLALWMFMRWNSSEVTLTFLELLCAYGYSLSIYVPVSILSVVQISWFQWQLTLAAATLSAFVLVSSLAPSVAGPKKIPVAIIVISVHLLLAVGFLLYFFHAPQAVAHLTEAPLHHVVAKNATSNSTGLHLQPPPKLNP